MSISQFFAILMARRLIVIATLIVAMAISVVVCVLLPAKFTATARILMDVIKPDVVSGQVISSNFARGYTQTQVELITDYRVAGDVVDRLKWDQDPKIVAEYQANTDGTSDFRRYMAQKIIDATDANLVMGSNILEISYKAGNPIVAKNVVGALRAAYIDASLRLRTDAASSSAEWYVDQAKKAQATLAAAETSKSNFERDNGIVMAPGGADSETMKLEQMQGAQLAARGSMALAGLAAEDPPSVQALKSQVNSLDTTMVLASQRLGTSHPNYIALVEQRKLLMQQIASESAAARAGASAAARAGLVASAGNSEGELAAQKARVFALKPKLDELGRLQREVDLRKGQYERAAERSADLKLEADVSETGLVPLGDAFVLGKPTSPNKPLILAVGAVAGLGVGLALAVFAELMSRRVRGPRDLAQAANTLVLAVIADTAPVSLVSRLRRA